MMALARAAHREPGGGLFAWWLGELRELLPSALAAADATAVACAAARAPVLAGSRAARAAAGSRSAACCCRISKSARVPCDRCCDRARGCGGRSTGNRGAVVLVLGEQDALTCVDLLPALGRERSRQDHGAQDRPADALVGRAGLCRAEGDGPPPRRHAGGPARRRGTGGPRSHPAPARRLRRDTGRRRRRDDQGAGSHVPVSIFCAAAPRYAAVVAGWCWQSRRCWSSPWPAVPLGRLADLPAASRLAEQAVPSAELEQRLADLPELRAKIDAMRVEAGFLADDRRSRPSPLMVLEALSRPASRQWSGSAIVTLEGREFAILRHGRGRLDPDPPGRGRARVLAGALPCAEHAHDRPRPGRRRARSGAVRSACRGRSVRRAHTVIDRLLPSQRRLLAMAILGVVLVLA